MWNDSWGSVIAHYFPGNLHLVKKSKKEEETEYFDNNKSLI